MRAARTARATRAAAAEAGAGGGSKGGAKRDGIAKFEQELHEGKVHAAVHAALGGVSGFSLSDLLVAALPMYLDLLDYAFVNPWVWRGGERGGASMVMTGFFVTAPVFVFLPTVLALLLVPASRGMARCGVLSSSGSTTTVQYGSTYQGCTYSGAASPTGRSYCCSRPSASSRA